MGKIQYNPLAMKEISAECSNKAVELEDAINSGLKDIVSANTGLVRNQIDTNIDAEELCMVNTYRLLNDSSFFMSELATYLEKQDKDIAKKLGE